MSKLFRRCRTKSDELAHSDDENDEEDDEDEEVMTEAERMEEGRRMFQIFAARMFEQRVLAAYRHKVRCRVSSFDWSLTRRVAGRYGTSGATFARTRGRGATRRGEGAQESQGESEEEGQEEVCRCSSSRLVSADDFSCVGIRNRKRRKIVCAKKLKRTPSRKLSVPQKPLAKKRNVAATKSNERNARSRKNSRKRNDSA